MELLPSSKIGAALLVEAYRGAGEGEKVREIARRYKLEAGPDGREKSSAEVLSSQDSKVEGPRQINGSSRQTSKAGPGAI